MKETIFTDEIIYSGIWDQYKAWQESGEEALENFDDEYLEWLIYDNLNEDFRYIKEQLDKKYPNGFIVTGALGLWYGTPEVATYCEDAEELFNALSLRSEHTTEIFLETEENKTELHVNVTHHDGTNRFVIRTLNDKQYNGYMAIKDYDFGYYDTPELLNNLFLKSQPITTIWE